jgi:hypothetical protein
MGMTRVRTATACVLLAIRCVLGAAEVSEFREHGELHDAGSHVYTFTTVTRVDAEVTRGEQFVLLRDERTNERWILHSVEDYARKQLIHEISDVKGETYLRITQPLEPILDLTAEANRERVRKFDKQPVRIETQGATRTASKSEWEQPENKRAWRSELRRSMSFDLIEAIERLRIVRFTNPIGIYYSSLMVHVLYDGKGDEGPVTVERPDADCAFDASFGFRCTKAQLEGLEKRRTDGETDLWSY